MSINKNTIKLPLDDARRRRIRDALSDHFAMIGDEDSVDEVTDPCASDERLAAWAREEFGDEDSFYEDDDGHLIDA